MCWDEYSHLSPAEQNLFRKYPFPSKKATNLTDSDLDDLTDAQIIQIQTRDANKLKPPVVRIVKPKEDYKEKCDPNLLYAAVIMILGFFVYYFS